MNTKNIIKLKYVSKRLNIECMHHDGSETYFNGTDECGNEFELVLDSLELLEFIDIKTLKQSLTKYIKKL